MQHDFWHERWRTGQTGFHRATAHTFLERWWPTLEVPTDARVYVPLCGKSLDMAWLAGRGHAVAGSELSPIAIGDFFASQGLAPHVGNHASYVVHAAGPYEILQGDALALTTAELGPVQAAYDRAALHALPPPMRADYARSFAALLPAGARVLLIALEYPQHLVDGPPFSVQRDEIDRLYGDTFTVQELERVELVDQNPRLAEAGVRKLQEVAYRMERKR